MLDQSSGGNYFGILQDMTEGVYIPGAGGESGKTGAKMAYTCFWRLLPLGHAFRHAFYGVNQPADRSRLPINTGAPPRRADRASGAEPPNPAVGVSGAATLGISDEDFAAAFARDAHVRTEAAAAFASAPEPPPRNNRAEAIAEALWTTSENCCLNVLQYLHPSFSGPDTMHTLGGVLEALWKCLVSGANKNGKPRFSAAAAAFETSCHTKRYTARDLEKVLKGEAAAPWAASADATADMSDAIERLCAPGSMTRAEAGNKAKLLEPESRKKTHDWFSSAGPFGAFVLAHAGLKKPISAAYALFFLAADLLQAKSFSRAAAVECLHCCLVALCALELHLPACEMDAKLRNVAHVAAKVFLLGPPHATACWFMERLLMALGQRPRLQRAAEATMIRVSLDREVTKQAVVRKPSFLLLLLR